MIADIFERAHDLIPVDRPGHGHDVGVAVTVVILRVDSAELLSDRLDLLVLIGRLAVGVAGIPTDVDPLRADSLDKIADILTRIQKVPGVPQVGRVLRQNIDAEFFGVLGKDAKQFYVFIEKFFSAEKSARIIAIVYDIVISESAENAQKAIDWVIEAAS